MARGSSFHHIAVHAYALLEARVYVLGSRPLLRCGSLLFATTFRSRSGPGDRACSSINMRPSSRQTCKLARAMVSSPAGKTHARALIQRPRRQVYICSAERERERLRAEAMAARTRPGALAAVASLLLLLFLQAAASAAAARQHHGLLADYDAASNQTAGGVGFVGVDGTQFVVASGNNKGKSVIYFSGFNAYWLMLLASDPARRPKVVAAFRQASEHGLNLARTWAFSDGGDAPLQSSPGVYNEAMFQALDFVIAEAGRHGIYLLLCLVNNFHDFGGKRQYVAWAREAGHAGLATADHFYNTTIVKDYYKNHVKRVLTRVNTVTGVAYRDDPTILGWELMNEPRCDADPTGAMVQAWVEEMAPYVKSVDGGNHLVTAGLEGFYGEGAHESKDLNPWGIYYGTNFVATHAAAAVDFATIHLYPDVWLWGSKPAARRAFLANWTRSHAEAAELCLAKPLLVTEYGKFMWEGVANATQSDRDGFLRLVLGNIYDSAAAGGPLVGGAFWQLLDPGMDALRDGYEIILAEDRRAATIIGNHSRLLAELNGQDVEEVRRRRRRRRAAARSSRKVASGSRSSSDSDTPLQLHNMFLLLVRFFSSLFRSV